MEKSWTSHCRILRAASNVVFLAILLLPCPRVQGQTANWIRFRIPAVLSISIPPCMELQGGAYKQAKDAILDSGVFDLSKDTTAYLKKAFVFQQVGLNESKAEARASYARIMVDFTKRPDDGLGPKLSKNDITESDIEVIEATQKTGLTKSLAAQGNPIVQWYGTKLIHLNKYSYLSTRYLRRFRSNYNVIVETNLILNRGLIITVTISCKEDESMSLYKDLWGVMDSVNLLEK
jgi:hypothetical protein